MKKLVLFLFGLIFIGCTDKKVVDEESILNNLIPTIVDSICHDRRIYFVKPPTTDVDIFNPDGSKIFYTPEFIAKDKADYLKRIASLKNSNSKFFLAIVPLLKFSSFEAQNKAERKSFFEEIFGRENKNIVLNFNKIKLNNNWAFIDTAKLPKNDEIFRKKYDFNFAGIFDITRINFNKDKTAGTFEASYRCDSRCGNGYRIFIKKIGNTWIIEKFEDIWIA